MIITTDKVYYNGKEFIVNQWAEEPRVNTILRAANVGASALNKVTHSLKIDTYNQSLTRSIEEGYVIHDPNDTIGVSIRSHYYL